MANRLVLKLYVASVVRGERTASNALLVASLPVKKFLREYAPRLLENLIENSDRDYGTKTPGKQKLLASLKVTNERLLREVIPIVACNPWIDVELYFSDSVITNAFKSKRIEVWAASNFCRRSGGAVLEHSEQWSRLYWLIGELGAEVCYNPLADETMIQLLSDTRQLV